MKISLFIIALLFSQYSSGFEVTDDENNTVTFEKHAKRIISLSPHATELLFAAGATDQIVATVSYSDYPVEAKKIPRIGSYKKIDLESVIKINPDLIVVWQSGGSVKQIQDFKRFGFKVYNSEPKSFRDVANNISNMGKILGTEKIADKKANEYLIELEELRSLYHNKTIVNVFYQVWNNPLMTINKDHLITGVIELCGGENVFGELAARAPRVSIESVIQKNPQAIIIGMSVKRESWINDWSKWGSLNAVKSGHIYAVNADYIVRQGPRILKGISQVCEILEGVRNHDD